MLQIPNNFTYLCPRAFRVSSIPVIDGGVGDRDLDRKPASSTKGAGEGTTLVSNGVNAKQSAMRHQ